MKVLNTTIKLNLKNEGCSLRGFYIYNKKFSFCIMQSVVYLPKYFYYRSIDWHTTLRNRIEKGIDLVLCGIGFALRFYKSQK